MAPAVARDVGCNSPYFVSLSMSSQELRLEIKKIIESIPDDSLKPLYDYLKEIESLKPEAFRNAGNIRKILEEDKNLLKRLAK